MLSLIMNKKEEINQLISDHVENGPHKFQLQGEIGLPPNLKKQQRNVVNFHNTSDHNCFLHCYYAAYPGKPLLYEPEQR